MKTVLSFSIAVDPSPSHYRFFAWVSTSPLFYLPIVCYYRWTSPLPDGHVTSQVQCVYGGRVN